MALCGGLTIGVDSNDPKHATIADGERGALMFFRLQSSFLGALREIGNRELDFGKTESFRAMKHRHDQPLAGADSDADVAIVVIDNVLIAHFRVDLRELIERIGGCFDDTELGGA